MASCAVLVLAPLWISALTQACRGEEPAREAVLSWFRERLLEGLGLDQPPSMRGPEVRHAPRRAPRTGRPTWVNRQSRPIEDRLEMILFPSSDSSCPRSDPAPAESPEGHFTYYFQPSLKHQETLVTSASFWFYAGEGPAANSSAQLFILTSGQQLLQAAGAPSETSPDGWNTFHLDLTLLTSVSEGPFLLQVRCPACQCHTDEPDKTPFLHLSTQPRGPVRSPRSAPLTIPWSPSALDLLQRPSQDTPQHSPTDCHRAEVQISFEDLGWGNWIVHPKVLTFSYCHGNCSSWDRTTATLGVKQCCAPVPGTMKSLRITTTSDGGYSFKFETLPNIIPEECTCI